MTSSSAYSDVSRLGERPARPAASPRGHEPAGLRELGAILTSSVGADEGITQVTTAVRSMFGAAESCIVLHDPVYDALVIQGRVFDIDDPAVLAHYRMELAEGGHTVGVFRSGITRIVNAPRAAPTMLQRHVELLGIDNVVSAALVTSEGPVGVLHVFNRAGGFRQTDADLLDLIAPFVSTWVAAQRLTIQRERHDRRVADLVRLHGDLTELVADRLGRDGLVELLGHHLGDRKALARRFRIAVIRCAAPPSGPAAPGSTWGLRPHRRELLDAVEDIYDDGLVVPWRDSMVAVLPVVTLDVDLERAERLVDRLGDRLESFGMSGPSAPARLSAALDEADHTAEVAAQVQIGTPRAFDQLGLLRVLRTEAAGSAAFAAEVLGPLRSHDASQSTDLVDTLRMWAACDYSITDAAVALDVHRNTVKYRLKRIRELFGFDPSTSPHRLRVELALQFEAVVPEPSSPGLEG